MKYIVVVLTLCIIVFHSNETCAQGKVTRKKTESSRIKSVVPKRLVQPKKTHGYLNGHEWVDLGLPSGTKWATMNIGATRVTDEGYYYAWGETSIPSISQEWNDGTITPIYSRECCRLYRKCMGSISGTSYGVAQSRWGVGWILPEKKDVLELEKYCYLEVVNISGVDGYRISGPNGNSVFFPCTAVYSGRCRPTKGIDTYSCYWIGAERSKDMGYLLHLGRMDFGIGINNKNVGYAVRAITRVK